MHPTSAKVVLQYRAGLIGHSCEHMRKYATFCKYLENQFQLFVSFTEIPVQIEDYSNDNLVGKLILSVLLKIYIYILK